jgi:hypothetical protein
LNKVPDVDLTTLAKLAPGDVRLLWVNDWYDGPLEAMVEHGGRRCLMVLHDQSSLGTDGFYRWVVFPLTPAQAAEEQSWHALFAEHVGEHWCFHPETPHGFGDDISRDPEKFYAPYKKREPLDLTASTAVGWLDEMPKT